MIGAGWAWLDLRKFKDKRVAVYQRRLLLTEVFRSTQTIIGVQAFHQALLVRPVYLTFSVIIATMLSVSIWGWFFHARGKMS